MKFKLTTISAVAIAFVSLLPASVWADNHSTIVGEGMSSTTSSSMKKGKTGHIVHSITQDFWRYSKAPEGWPGAAVGTCHQTILLSPENTPINIRVTCESVDGDGDASVWSGVVDPATGKGKGQLLAGTGKYANGIGDISFATVIQIDENNSVYGFSN